MFCKKCGTSNPVVARFCENCGSNLIKGRCAKDGDVPVSLIVAVAVVIMVVAAIFIALSLFAD